MLIESGCAVDSRWLGKKGILPQPTMAHSLVPHFEWQRKHLSEGGAKLLWRHGSGDLMVPVLQCVVTGMVSPSS